MGRRYAETMLYWRGHLRADEVAAFLDVSERTARSLISDWRTLGILPRYRPTAERRLVPAKQFDPGPVVTDPTVTYAMLMLADQFPGNPFSRTSPIGGAHDLSISATVSTRASRELLAACLDREAVHLIYASKTGIQEFTFSPSAIVRARGRYHFRGFREDGRDRLGNRVDDRYVDLVPARAIEAWRAVGTRYVGIKGDESWKMIEKRRLFLSPELSKEERLSYEHEYGIADRGVLVVRTRRALMRYVLQELSERRCWRRDGSSVPIWMISHSASDKTQVS